MLQSQNTAFPRHQSKQRLETNNDKTNVTLPRTHKEKIIATEEQSWNQLGGVYVCGGWERGMGGGAKLILLVRKAIKSSRSCKNEEKIIRFLHSLNNG